MGRAAYRGGPSRLLTTRELASILPIPLYRILTGSAKVSFVYRDVSNPSPLVSVIGVRTVNSLPSCWMANLPVFINGDQWQKVGVPVLENINVSDWIGLLTFGSDPVVLPVGVVGVDGESVVVGGRVLIKGLEVGEQSPSRKHTGDLFEGETEMFIRLLSDLIAQQGEMVGYGPK